MDFGKPIPSSTSGHLIDNGHQLASNTVLAVLHRTTGRMTSGISFKGVCAAAETVVIIMFRPGAYRSSISTTVIPIADELERTNHAIVLGN